jgi:hypothetical protein
MATKVAINGFGRIGRLLYRAALETGTEIDFAVVNDLTDAKTLAHLLKNDTVHGKLPFDVEAKEDTLIIKKDGVVKQKLKVLAQPDPAKLPWKEMGVYGIHWKVQKEGSCRKTSTGRSQKSVGLRPNEPSSQRRSNRSLWRKRQQI